MDSSFSLWHGAVIFGAAVVAGMINSVAGGGTLVSFPALVWLGRDPIVANVTSTVALWPGSLGGMLGYRREIGDSTQWMVRLAGPSILGGLVGAFLLLRTSSRTFAALVPYLILFATILFAAQAQITHKLHLDTASDDSPPHKRWWVAAACFQFLVAVYGGYFGAGIGILMLAALGLLGLTDIHQMNGLKNFFAVCINLIAATYFMLWGPVNWTDGAVMAAGAVAGGYGGAGLARRLGREFVRRAVVVIGLVVTVSFLWRR